MAFDCTYLSKSLAQLQLHEERGMVGGVFLPEAPSNAFLPLNDRLDVKSIVKSGQMLEMLMWDPVARRKTPLSVCSLPIAEGFQGTNAKYRSSLYILEIVGKVLDNDDATVKAVIFDNATQHLLLRQIVFGQKENIVESDLAEIPFFSTLRFKELPRHPLPRLPVRIALQQGEVFWAIPGVCFLAPYSQFARLI